MSEDTTTSGKSTQDPTPSRSSLEEVVEAGAASSKLASPPLPKFPVKPKLPTVLELVDYKLRFNDRYHNEDSFQEIVHDYLDLTVFQRTGLFFGKRLFKGWYERKTDGMVETYAVQVREGLLTARDLMEQQLLEDQLEDVVEDQEEELLEVKSEFEQADNEYSQVRSESEQAKTELVNEVSSDYEERKKELEDKKIEVVNMATAKQIVSTQVKKNIENSDLVQVDERGNLKFDEEKIVEVLEDMFLDEIIEGIEKEDGTGFYSKIKSDFEGLVSYYEQIQNLSDLHKVNWTMSTVYSRTRGYNKAVFPYLMVGQGEGFKKAKASIDTATSLDTSGSMQYNNRLTIAKKTTLSINALMRRLNPNNNTYLSHYGSVLREITSAELLRKIEPAGLTRTDKALNWLVDKLADSGPSIANLVTDGLPEGCSNIVKRCEEAAERFRDHPYIMLRIYLIDGDDQTENIIRKIGRAAGENTKFVPIKNYELGGSVIRNIHQAIQGMYDLENF